MEAVETLSTSWLHESSAYQKQKPGVASAGSERSHYVEQHVTYKVEVSKKLIRITVTVGDQTTVIEVPYRGESHPKY
jgi:hypothetical protein